MPGMPEFLLFWERKTSSRLVGKDKYDYLEAKTYSSLLEHLVFLKENPSQYKQMVNNGFQSKEQYSAEVVKNRWIEVIEKIIYPKYYGSKFKAGNV